MALKSIVIEGCDRLGKDTLIKGIQNELGYFQTLHYQKPEKLDYFNGSLFSYQFASFNTMFHILSSNARFILNRAHLGEAVYSKRYRDYDGNYVFSLEKDHRRFWDEDTHIFPHKDSYEKTTLLVLLYTSDFSFIKDDGQSFDFEKKEEEQADFLKAFDKSIIENKIMIDVSNGMGGYRPALETLKAVIDAYKMEAM
jgi:hypothetical protein